MKKMKIKLIALSAFLALGLSGTAAAIPGSAALDLSGAFSCDLEGATCNYTDLLDFGTGGTDANITAITWEIGIETVGASWLSEANIGLDLAPFPISLAPGAGDDFSGNGFYSGSVTDAELFAIFNESFSATGGIVNIEIFESFDDVADEIDAFFLEGSYIAFDFDDDDDSGDDGTAIPEPGILALLGLGLIGVFGARRRRV